VRDMEGNRKKEDGPNGSPSSKHGLVDRSKEKRNMHGEPH
jgi:hypothetical protein